MHRVLETHCACVGPLRRVQLMALLIIAGALPAQEQPASPARSSASRLAGDSVTFRIADADVRSALLLLARYLDRPLVISPNVSGGRVALETPRPVPLAAVPGLLRSIVAAQGLEVVEDTLAGVLRVSTPPAPRQDPTASSAVLAPYSGRAESAMQLWVIPIRYARAVRVAAVVNALYGRASALGELGASPATLTEQLRAQSQATLGVAATPGSGGADITRVGATGLGLGTVVIPDDGTNSLLVRGTAADHAQVLEAVRALDVRPLQVLIEVLIAEVRRDRQLSFGLEVVAPEQAVPNRPNVTVSGRNNGIGLGDFVVRVMRQGSIDATGVLRAAASRGDARIVSRPVLVTVNNEQAEILVGSQRPFVQVQRSLPTDAPVRDQVVQYRDVGTRLLVRPTISADGFVAMQITQEVNAATTETQFDAPVISTRNVQTRLIVRDSQTIVLGGLSDRQSDVTQGGIPLLSDIPWIGGLFGRATRRAAETEFFLFLTPRILRDDATVERLTRPLHNRAPH
jgi:general secretion pathway protein D